MAKTKPWHASSSRPIRLGDFDPSPAPLSSKSFRTPNGCWIRFAEIHPKGVEVGYDCHGPQSGGRGTFRLPDGMGHSNYPKAFVKGARSVRTPGASTSGHGAHVGFELSPGSVSCAKRAGESELVCKVTRNGETLSGKKRRRR